MLRFPGEERSKERKKLQGFFFFSFKNKIPSGLWPNVVTWEETGF